MSDLDFEAAQAEAVRVALDPASFPEQKLQTYFPLLRLVLDTMEAGARAGHVEETARGLIRLAGGITMIAMGVLSEQAQLEAEGRAQPR